MQENNNLNLFFHDVGIYPMKLKSVLFAIVLVLISLGLVLLACIVYCVCSVGQLIERIIS